MSDSHADDTGLTWGAKLTLSTVFAATSAAVFLASDRLPPRFEAEASLLVKQGREFAYRPEVGSDSGNMLDLEEIVNSEVALLESRDLARAVVEEIGAAAMYPDLVESTEPAALVDLAVSIYRDSLTVRGVEQSSVIRLRFEHADAAISARALNYLLAHFERRHLEIFREPRSDFLGEQLTASREQHASAMEALERFRQEHGIFDLPEQRRLMLSRKSELDATRRMETVRLEQLMETMAQLGIERSDEAATLSAESITSRRAHVLSRNDSLRDMLRETDFELAQLRWTLDFAARSEDWQPASSDGPPEESKAVQDARFQRLELELQEKELAKKFSPTSREIQSIRERIEVLDRFLEEQVVGAQASQRLGRAHGLQVIESQVSALDAKREWLLEDLESAECALADLTGQEMLCESRLVLGTIRAVTDQLELLEAELGHLDLNEPELRRLERTVILEDRRVQSYSDLYDQARITDELDSRGRINVRVIERASEPTRPIELSTKIRIVLSAGAGLAAALTIGLLFGMLRPQGRRRGA